MFDACRIGQAATVQWVGLLREVLVWTCVFYVQRALRLFCLYSFGDIPCAFLKALEK